MTRLTPSERFTLLRIAEAATPPGAHIRLPDGETIARVEGLVSRLGAGGMRGYRSALVALDLAAVPLTGQRLSALAPEPREAALLRLHRGDKTSILVRAVTLPIKIARSGTEGLAAAVHAHDGRRLPVIPENQRWEAQITDGGSFQHDETMEVDVVVVGTGAGGAPMANALAARGHAVLMLEAGAYFGREDFAGDPISLQQKLYWNGGLTATLGNTLIPVPMGRTVGGTTTVNSGTCFRTPERTLRRWQLELGLHDLGPGALDSYFEKVESVLQVEKARDEVLGGCARVIARGCDALGYAHGPLPRNAPGCDGQGVCCFGCPTDAKRSTNVSYIPSALQNGAALISRAFVTEVIVEGGRAVGVRAKIGGDNGGSSTLTVRARAVVLSCGTVHTASLLLRQGIANSSDQVGRNLTIHPATYSWAAFDESIGGFDAIPQGYGVEEFTDQGINFEGAFVPLSLATGSIGAVGRRWTELVERLDSMACFGFMIADSSRGRVTLGPGGKPSMSYRLPDEDVRRVVRGHGILARIYLAAGAQSVHPGLGLYDELRTLEDVEDFEREGPSRLRPRHLDLSAYHPLGTCRMGADPRRSVVGPTNETWDVPGLFICDGSAVSGPLGVNPQITIMALSERAAAFVEARASEAVRPRAPKPQGGSIAFAETMSGMCSLEADEGGGTVDVSFTVEACGDSSLEKAWRGRGGTWRLEGTIGIDGVATARVCEGTLLMRPLKRHGTLVYDLAFDDDDGNHCTLHGEKHTKGLAMLRGMTTLYTELRRDGFLLGRGVLTFDLDDIPSWLMSWRLSSSSKAS